MSELHDTLEPAPQELTQDDRDRLFAEQAIPLIDQLFGAALGMTRNRADAEDLVRKLL